MTIGPSPTQGFVTAVGLAELYDDPNVLPLMPGQDFMVSKAPTFNTGVRQSASGREIRAAYWSASLWNFKIRFNFLREYIEDSEGSGEFATLLGFFSSRLGKFGFFYYLDPTDYQAVNETVAQADGVSTNFQLTRTVGGGTPYGFIEPVYGLWNAPVVEVNGVVTACTANPWGQIVFAAAPAAGALITWSGSFLFVCRFDTDTLDAAQVFSQLWSVDGLPFVSLRP